MKLLGRLASAAVGLIVAVLATYAISPASAGPVVQSGPRLFASAGGGTNVDGANVVLTGPTATKPSVEWLGGPSGVIESGSNGAQFTTLRSNWVEGIACSHHPAISTEFALNRTKAILADTRTTGEYKQTLHFDTGVSGYSTLYVQGWIYFGHDTISTGYLQWKMIRFTRTQTVVDGDGAYMANRKGTNQSFFTLFNSSGGNALFYDNGVDGNDLPDTGWFRYEMWLNLNSSPGTADGFYRVRVKNTSGTTVVDNTSSNRVFNGSSDSGNFRYVTPQNYFGNADVGGSSNNCAGTPANDSANSNANAYAAWEELAIQWVSSGTGAQVHAELCNSATYSSASICTYNEVVSIVGTTWTVKLNKGRHSGTDLTGLWMHMFNASGTDTVVQL